MRIGRAGRFGRHCPGAVRIGTTGFFSRADDDPFIRLALQMVVQVHGRRLALETHRHRGIGLVPGDVYG